MTATTRSTTPCVICGATGEPSTEHVIARWIRKALMIDAPVSEYRESEHVRTDETLAIVLHGVCVACNKGWLNYLEQQVRPVLEPLILRAAPGTSRMLDPADQAILATWAVKTSLLLTLGKFRQRAGGWIPADNLEWLRQHYGSGLPPPGAHVWLGGLRPIDKSAHRTLSASTQAMCRLDSAGQPIAHIGTFTVGFVLLQVYCCELRNAARSPGGTWLAPRAPYRSSLLQIAPSTSSIYWPPDAVFTVDAIPIVGRRFDQDN